MLVPLAAQLILIFQLSEIEKKAEADAARADKARRISTEVNNLVRDMADIASITGVGEQAGVDTILSLKNSIKGIVEDFKRLEKLVEDDPEKLAIVAAAKKSAGESGWIFKELLASNISGSIAHDDRKELWHRLRVSVKGAMSKKLIAMNEKELSISDQSPRAQAELRQYSRDLLMGFAVFDITCAILISLFIAVEIKKRLDRLVENTTRLGIGKELLPHIKGSDELSVLDSSFHNMADLLNEASRKERAATENAVDMICSINKNLQFVSANPASEKILDQPLSDIIGRRLSEFVQPESWPAMEKAIAEVQSQNPVESLEIDLIDSKKQIVHSLWSMRFSKVEGTIFAVVHNITERKRAEEMQKALVAMMTHDLRSPLNAVGNVLEMLSMGYYGELGDQGNNMVELATRNTQQMRTLVDNMLDHDKMQAGKLSLSCKKVEVENLFNQSRELVLPNAVKKKIEIAIKDGNVSVDADEEKISRVLVNLLSNAIKYCPENSAISLSCSSNDGYATLEVSDNGPGIADENLPHLFDPYYQTDAEHSNVGTGLGLTVCKELVTLHGGKIWVTSKLGEGTQFHFTLPLT